MASIIYTFIAFGKNKKPIKVRKLRTMYDGAERYFDELAGSHGLDELGKIVDDPRVIPSRRFLRESGLDELPQFLEVLRFRMRIVGIRPKPEGVWKHYPGVHMEEALRYSPGWIPVNYLYNDGDCVEAERKWLAEKKLHPLWTDVKYFFVFWHKYLFQGLRSR